MKQIIQSYKTGKMKLEDIPRPQVMPGMVLVQNKVSLVSAGTEKMLVDLAKKSLLGKAKSRPDLVKKVIDTAKKEGILSTFNKVRSKLDTPIPLGYSCAGIVREVGAGVDTFQVGDLVVCGGAGYANHSEFNVVPKNLCVRIPEGPKGMLSFEEATFATVGAIALQGVRQAALTLGETVCVIGLGLMGQITAQLCRSNGCRVIGADIDEKKIIQAMELGAEKAVHSDRLEKAVRDFTRGVGADAVIITAAAHGSQLIETAAEISRVKGRVVAVGFIGLNVPREVFYKKELDLRMSMSYGPGRYDAEYEERGHDYPLPYVRWTEQRNMQTILELCSSGMLDVKPLITHRFPFEKSLEAYELILSGKEPYLGVLLEYAAHPQEGIVSMPSVQAIPVADSSIRLGVLGAGNFAKGVLLPRFVSRKDIQLVGVATGRGMTAKAVSEQFGFGYAAEGPEKIIEDSQINAVLIATRHNLHGPLVKKALEAGKHVFVEKPLCLDIKELQEILAALKNRPAEKDERSSSGTFTNASSGQSMLMVGFNRRFSPFVKKAREWLRETGGPSVLLYTVNAGFIPRESWIQDPNEGGGRILGEVCHFVDTLRFLSGASVSSVSASCIRTEDRSQVNRDSVAITLQYRNGTLGTIIYQALGSRDVPKERIEISSGGSTVIVDDFRKMDIFSTKKESVKKVQDKGFDGEIEAFVNALTRGETPPIPLADLFESTLVTFAIHASLNTGERVDLNTFARENHLPEFPWG